MTSKFLHPDTLMPDVRHGFTHVALTFGSKMVHCGGQVALDADMNLVGGQDLGLQMQHCFKCCGIALAAGGATPADVVRQHVYLVNHKRENIETIVARTAEFYAPGEPPPSTLIGIQALAFPEFLVEIEVTAIID